MPSPMSVSCNRKIGRSLIGSKVMEPSRIGKLNFMRQNSNRSHDIQLNDTWQNDIQHNSKGFTKAEQYINSPIPF
jgi:hypothetical protein